MLRLDDCVSHLNLFILSLVKYRIRRTRLLRRLRQSVARAAPRRGREWNKKFWALADRFELRGHVDLRRDWNPSRGEYRFTLFRLISDEKERALPLPDQFVAEMRELIFDHFGERTRALLGVSPVFEISHGRTSQEVRDEIAEHERHLRLFDDLA